MPHFLKRLALRKVAVFLSELSPAQKMPCVYLAEWSGKEVLVMDTLLANEDRHPEYFPILPIRVLALSGVAQFFVFAEACAADPSFQVGDVFLPTNYMPISTISPFIGMHWGKWGYRFLDVTAIFSEENSKIVHAAMDKRIPLKSGPVMCVNPFKPFCDPAELSLAQSLRIPAVLGCGLSQALTLHDMHRTFAFFGVVDRSMVALDSLLTNEAKDKIAEQLVNVLAADLKPREPFVDQ